MCIKQIYRFFLLFIIIHFFTIGNSTIIPQNYRFYNPKNGFHGDKVKAIIQDATGYLWLGTNEGIFIYNGNSFNQIIVSDSNINKIAKGIITHLFRDSKKNIWISSTTGLALFNPITLQWSKIKFLNLKNIYINGITEDESGCIWLGTDHGIFKIKKKDQVEYIKNSNSISNITSIIQAHGQTWLTTHNSIFQINKFSSLPEHKVTFTHLGNITDNFQTTICNDSYGNIWIGKYNGLIYKYSPKENRVEYLDIKKITNNNSAIINHISYDNYTKLLWICVDEGGIYCYDIKTRSLKKYIYKNLPTLKVTRLLIDRERNFWFSMEKNGLAMTNRLLNAFSLIDPTIHTKNSIVSAILKDSKGNLWVGTDGGGLLVYDSSFNLKEKFIHQSSNTKSIGDNAILAIHEDRKHRIWIGSFRGGLSLFNKSTKTFTNYKADESKNNSLKRNDIRKIVEDKEGNLWLVVHGYGIAKFIPEKNTFTNFNNISSVWAFDLIIDHQGTIWVASNNGLSYYDKKINDFKILPNSQDAIDIHTLHEDKNKRLWIGTVQGLCYLGSSDHIIKKLSFESILNHVSINSIEEVSENTLIIATSKGIVLFNTKTNYTSYFTTESGLPSDEFIVNASYIAENGIIYLGSNKGLCFFNPEELPVINYNTKPNIQDVLLFNQSILSSLQLKQGGRTFSHSENNLTFQFTYPYFLQSNKDYLFEYQLEGVDKNWILTNGTMAQYPSLPPGSYTFRTRVVSKSSSDIKSPESTLIFQILPPFWETWWFRVSILAIIFCSIYIYNSVKTKRVIALNKSLEDKINLRTEELHHQNELLKRQRLELESANNTKDKLFSIIAHDLRSPFTSVLGITHLLKEKINELNSNDIRRMSELIYQSSLTSLQLLDNLLEWARSHTASIKFFGEDFNIYQVITETVKPLEFQISQKNIFLQIHANTSLELYSDKEIIKTILRNLLTNAIKYTHSTGTIDIELKVINNELIQLVIKDNGIGMPSEVINSLLHTKHLITSSKGTENEKGTGLGLIICKEFLHVINGTWEFRSIVNQGTSITLYLPGKVSIGQDVEEYRPSYDMYEKNAVVNIPTNIKEHDKKDQKILIIDDTPEVIATITFILEPYFQVLTASNGIEGIQTLQSAEVDLILSDVVMPEMDGIQFTSLCKGQEEFSHIPILLLTSQKTELDIIKGLQTGADDYLIKPIHSEILLLKINQTLNRFEKLRKKFTLSNQSILEIISENSVEKQLLQRILETIDKHMVDEKFGVEELSKEIGMHRSSLSKKVINITGVSPQELIKTQRLKKAAQLLLASGLTISEVAYDVGFSDPKYFSKSFKIYFGLLPSEYIKINKD